MKKRSMWGILMLCVVLIFASCGNGGSQTTGADGKKILKLGLCDAFSGAGAVYGLPQKEAIEMAMEEINSSGGIQVGEDTYQIKLVKYDNKSDPNEGVAALRKLIDRDGVNIVTGWANSGVAMGVASIIGNEDVLIVVGTAGEESVTTQGYDNVVRIRPPAGYTGSPAGMFVADKGVKTIGVIGQLKDPFYQQYTDHFVKSFEKKGGKIVATESFAMGDRDMYTQLTSLLAKKPEAIFVPGYVEQAAFVYRQLGELKYEGTIYGFTGGSEEQFLNVVTKEQMEGIYDLRPVEGTIEALGETAAAYHKNYIERYGKEPTPNAIYAYDSIYALKAGIEKAGTVDDIHQIAAAMRDMDVPKECALNYVTVDGKMFDVNGQTYTTNIALIFKDGKWEVESELPADADTFSAYMTELTKQRQ